MTTTLQTYAFTNPGFETGDLTGWSVDNANISVVTFGFDDPPRTGSFMAKGGLGGGVVGVTNTNLWQVFDLSAWAAYIDTGLCAISAWTIYHATRDDQVDDGKIGGTFYSNSDGTGSVLDSWLQLAPNHSPRPGWEALTLSSRTVPVGARSVKLNATSIWFEGGQNDNYWDDAQPFDLTYSGAPLGETHDFTLALSGDLTLGIQPPSTEHGVPPPQTWDFTLDLRGTLRLGLAAQKYPLFSCPAPTAKTWDRPTIAAKSWGCVTVVPAEECDGVDTSTGDWLAAVNGDDLVSVSDYQLKAA